MPFWISLDRSGPLWRQTYRAIRAEIRSGRLRTGARLPSTRTLSADLGLSRTTVQEAYDQLTVEGWLVARVGSGTRVAPHTFREPPQEPPSKRPPRLSRFGVRIPPYPYDEFETLEPAPYEFLYGIPGADHFPMEIWRRLLTRRARDADSRSLSYAPPEGIDELRMAIAAQVHQSRGVRCGKDQVLVVAGIQQGLDLVCRILLDEGDPVLLEEPGYLGARTAFAAAGAAFVPAPVDEEGMDITGAPACKLAYVTPSHQFPTGAVMSLRRRLQLLQWAEDADAYVFEDDYDSEFRYGGRPIESLQALDTSGRVIYAGTYSKTLFPALRVGYLVLPPELVQVARSAKWVADWSVPTLTQEALADFLMDGHFDRHIRRCRAMYGKRRRALVSALAEHGIEVGGAEAGLHVLAWLDRPIGDPRARGVGVYSIAPYYLSPPVREGLLLGFTLLNEQGIREGIARLFR